MAQRLKQGGMLKASGTDTSGAGGGEAPPAAVALPHPAGWLSGATRPGSAGRKRCWD